MYAAIKYSHMLFITISILLFQYRFFLKIFNKPISRFLKIIPHVNDTLLLVSAISLAYIANFNPFYHTWLAAKIIALVIYIGFGFMALKSSGLKSILGYIFATATFVFMLLTAISKTPFFIAL
ncbi:MAG: SirB2 family protein [Alcanivoracaceae bacterium]|nr:SirB2 family protein [Alcanivoracaceae bacterium]